MANPVMTLPIMAPSLCSGLRRSRPGRAGPFSLSEPAVLRTILGAAGWNDVQITDVTLDEAHPAGDADSVADVVMEFNPLLVDGLQRHPDLRPATRAAIVDASDRSSATASSISRRTPASSPLTLELTAARVSIPRAPRTVLVRRTIHPGGTGGSAMTETTDWNRKTIEEFRANGGQVGGNFAGAPLLLLHTTGARSGQERINPMMYQDLGDGRVAVFASRPACRPTRTGTTTSSPTRRSSPRSARRPGATRPPCGRRRTGTIWSKQKGDYPGFADYEAKTDREIPVVILEPI